MNAPQSPARDAHAAILHEAATLRQHRQRAFRDTRNTKALGPLVDSARQALERSVPSSFHHLGRIYFLRCSLPEAHLMIFEDASSLRPLTFAMSGSDQEFGHEPPFAPAP